MSEVLRYVLDTITPASAAHAEGARLHLAKAGTPMLERLGMTVAGAQHTPRPRADKRTIVVVAGDHGAGDPGISLGASHPTIIAAAAIADGSSALSQIARASRAPIVLVAAGVQEKTHLPAMAIELAGKPSANIAASAELVQLGSSPKGAAKLGARSIEQLGGRRDAMTLEDAVLGIEAGIALAISLSEPGPDRPRDLPTQPGLDVLALGAIGVGSDVASAALLGAALGAPVTGLGDPVAEAAAARGADFAAMRSPTRNKQRTSESYGLELLAAFGGPDTAVLAGLILAAASMNVPVILDGYATGAAALIAIALAPDVKGYLVAAHNGTFTMPRLLAHLGIQPVFEVGLGHGEGTGAAMALPMLDQVAAIASGA
ncbi:MAG TPA: nicotinate-nucleotide--dimethylbenzimidazole phosphoribosyltransferase [Kofleriaceae bacterium]|jgi:nicotinate-nucleotide--dimethylbenzimidazole phosphoribosyltransferase